MNRSDETRLMPHGDAVPFRDVARTLQQAARGLPGDAALIATVVVIGSTARLAEAAAALDGGAAGGAVRTVLISPGDDPAPTARIVGHAAALEGLLPEFVDNAVAALRLSSLPTLVWWRGGPLASLTGLAALADRLVLDDENPEARWHDVADLVTRTAVTDLRWTRLTRWRALTAHFFDMPDVRGRELTHLSIEAGDLHAARLYGGWLASSLGWNGRVAIDIREVPGGDAIEAVRLSGGGLELKLTRDEGGTCVHTVACIGDKECASRTVALGDGALRALIAEELRVRSRDLSFERAVAALEEAA